MPAVYRAVLFIVAESVLFGTVAFDCVKQGPGWLLIGWPFSLVATATVEVAILRAFPPKLEPHAEGCTWLMLD